MADTTARSLALLDLLQRHRQWTGAELAARLRTTERTIRRDIERLRELGYRIGSTAGREGGYRLESGGTMPPLLLSEEEAVAIAVGLRVAAAEQLVDGAATALSAIAKLEQVLEPQLRRKVTALSQAMTAPTRGPGADVLPALLGQVALACRDRERVRFAYEDAQGRTSRRRVDPHALAPARGRWYLVAWDLEREDWRTFRLDRMAGLTGTGARFTPHALTREEIDERVLVASSAQRQPVEAFAVLATTLADFEARMGVWADGATAPAPGTTRWGFGGSDVRDLMYAMSWLPQDVDWTVEIDPTHRSALAQMLTTMLRGIERAPAPSADPPEPS
ncbi:YafY family protein [Demequina sp. NBRC 110053]|uniref:helix-turn-helix transcriptional regulator n=1 Tax=Demequina sp. NBRC 110053 TaxID=1570342 RepID=UPI000A03D632|nr:YafY family protein [Demequina sp. NBRC 110053]